MCDVPTESRFNHRMRILNIEIVLHAQVGPQALRCTAPLAEACSGAQRIESIVNNWLVAEGICWLKTSCKPKFSSSSQVSGCRIYGQHG